MRNSFYRLVRIVRRLRGKNGCAWDRKQTLKSIRENILEEAYETVDAINNNDYGELKIEAGDLLLQAVFISQIASETGRFNIKEVIDSLIAKLTRRHPHIFSNLKVKNTKELLLNWEKIKQAEKKKKTDLFSGIPAILPALLKAKKIQSKLERLGAAMDSPDLSLKKIAGQIALLKRDAPSGRRLRIRREYGEILFNLIHLARHYEINPEEELNKRLKKYMKDFRHPRPMAKKRTGQGGAL